MTVGTPVQYRGHLHRKPADELVRDSALNRTYMARVPGRADGQTQLRHLSPESTMKYDQVPVEDRQDALDRMG